MADTFAKSKNYANWIKYYFMYNINILKNYENLLTLKIG
jgi:hypothetical protein